MVYKRGSKRLKSGERGRFCTKNRSLLKKFLFMIGLLYRDHNCQKCKLKEVVPYASAKNLPVGEGLGIICQVCIRYLRVKKLV